MRNEDPSAQLMTKKGKGSWLLNLFVSPALLAAKPPVVTTPRSELTRLFQRAFALVSRPTPDYDAARDLIVPCVEGDPGNAIFVESLLTVLRRAEVPEGRRPGLFRRWAFQRALIKGRWMRALQLGVRLLVQTPVDPHLLWGLAEASEKLDYQDVSRRYVIAVAESHPNVPEIQRRAARDLSRRGLFDHARDCCHRALELDSTDKAAHEMLRQLTSGVDEGRVVASPLESPRERPEVDGDTGQIRARQLIEQGDIDAAEVLLADLRRDAPTDYRVGEMLEDVELEKARRRLEIARRQSESAQSQLRDDVIGQLQDDLNRREIEVFSGRCRRYPGQHEWKLRLAIRLKVCGNYSEALGTLRDIPDSWSRRPEAVLEIGECMQYQKRFDEALANYETAIETLELEKQRPSVIERALRRAGTLALAMGNTDRARRYLRRLSRLDPHDEVTRGHLDKLDEIRDKE